MVFFFILDTGFSLLSSMTIFTDTGELGVCVLNREPSGAEGSFSISRAELCIRVGFPENTLNY